MLHISASLIWFMGFEWLVLFLFSMGFEGWCLCFLLLLFFGTQSNLSNKPKVIYQKKKKKKKLSLSHLKWGYVKRIFT